MSIEAGALYVVATPIGNLKDVSARALKVLVGVTWVAAEDTRRSRRLLARYGIGTALLSVHEHNERRVSRGLVERLLAGQSGALISDAGTPLLSDPGFCLVREAHAAGVPVRPVPGPSAITAALSVAGLPTDRFVFEGFLPAREGARRHRLKELAGESRTLVFLEAPHRIVDSLGDLADAFGSERAATLARELTKVFEEVLPDTLGGLVQRLIDSPDSRKGEMVLLVQGRPRPDVDVLTEEAERVLRVLLEELSVRQAVSLAARLTGGHRKRLYRRAVEIKASDED